jgi:maltooligosyltrehalose synthase
MRQRPELPLGKAWGDTTLVAEECAGKPLVNSFTGEDMVVPENGRIPLARLFAEFPVAMLRA